MPSIIFLVASDKSNIEIKSFSKTSNNNSIKLKPLSVVVFVMFWANNNLVDDYRELIKSKKIAQQVIKNLNLPYSPEKLISKIQVESVNDTNLLKIIITDKNSYVARDIANEIADVFVNKEVEYYYNIKNIGVVDKAEASKTPYNINIVKQIILSILIGFILGCGTVFIIYYFDNTIKDKETVEEKLKLPVIGSIPQTGGSK